MTQRLLRAHLIVILLLFSQQSACASQVYLKNGDRISGRIIKEDETGITVLSEAAGPVVIDKMFVDRVISDEDIEKAKAEEEKEKLWRGEISAGYDKLSGNTEKSRFAAGLSANRKTEDDEFALKGDALYSSSDGHMDAQKWSGMARYAYSFYRRKWYNFYKFEGSHDKFADVDYRLIPSAGIGYWLYDLPDIKAMAEVAIGLEHTNYIDRSKNDNEAVLIPRAFFEKRLFGESRISEDITVYPSLTNTGGYRLRSETTLTNPVTEKMSVRLSVIDEYTSDPPGDAKKNDIQIISSLVYSF